MTGAQVGTIAGPGGGAACVAEGHCITCGDEGVAMRVLELGADGADCVEDSGTPHAGVAVDLVLPVAPGDVVLVHAGVAIRNLGTAP